MVTVDIKRKRERTKRRPWMRESAGVLPRRARAKSTTRNAALVAWRRDPARIGLALALYGVATALLIQRAPVILGSERSWLVFLPAPVLTLLVEGLQTGTALALVLAYDFVSATAMSMRSVPLNPEEFARYDLVLLSSAHTEFRDPALYRDTKLVVDTRNVVRDDWGPTVIRA